VVLNFLRRQPGWLTNGESTWQAPQHHDANQLTTWQSIPQDELRYRPDIDGLRGMRGIAVLAVVGYHAVPGLVRGGFVGVDVFFVISGYLISGIILEALCKGSFTFQTFYARRIKRIFPALILVLAFSYGVRILERNRVLDQPVAQKLVQTVAAVEEGRGVTDSYHRASSAME
jgi:peptidoglycan/LPS O-acetylase OafA/YrhL